MESEYLTKNFYRHPAAILLVANEGRQGGCNSYGLASFLLSCGYCAHHETRDNGEAPRARAREILGLWLTEDRERNLFLRHTTTLTEAAEQIVTRLAAPS
jgi:hypothetical protein